MLLILPLYLVLLRVGWWFRLVIKTVADIENILNDYDFFGDTVDTPKEGIEQHKKWECLTRVISRRKACLLGREWTQEKVGKSRYETTDKIYAEYKQHGLNEKSEKTGKALSKHVINLHSTGISRVAKIRDVKILQQDVENDPIIKYQMANLRLSFSVHVW